MSLLIKRPQHALLPWRVIFVLTFLFVLLISALVSYINSAFSTSCGTTTPSGDYTIVSFTTVGSCNWTVPNYVNTVDVLIVGGGGAGGSADNGAGGGGGGGQVKTQTNYSVSGTLTISVGAGGVPTATADMYPGGDGGTTSVTPSSGSAITALGGSGGASVTPGGTIGDPSNSGFNGGGGSTWAALVTNGSAGMVGGFSGGNAFGSGSDANVQAAGGGGGSGANGSNAASSAGGSGGIGLTSSVTNNATYYGGGGGGGKRYNNGTSGTGGTGGGGNGGKDSVGAIGTANTGGGGGGAGGASVSKQGGSGGSGIVVIKFISQCSPTITTASSTNYKYSFNTTGTCNWVTPNATTNFSAIVVGGGGSGGNQFAGGGGGGGIAANSSLSFSANEILTITVGSGATFSGSSSGFTGGTSTLARNGSTIATATGGTGGGNWNGSTTSGGNPGGAGGSATASGWLTYSGANGGNGTYFSGGASTYGSDGTLVFGNYFSGGGGGGFGSLGGLGGGGNAAAAATANTGGGGGGGNGSGAPGGNGGAGTVIFTLNNFDSDAPTLTWTTPSVDTYVSNAGFTPSWSLSDATSGISSGSGVAKRQYTTLSSGNCGSTWTTDSTQTNGSAATLTANRCYRWTFDSTLSAGASSPADNVGNLVTSNLTSSIIKFDQAPTVASITTSASDGIYNANQVITFTVTFSETVTVTGTPILTLETGSNDLTASCSQITPSTTMTCSATIRSEDASTDLDYVSTSAISLPSGATIQDLYALNDAVLTLPASPGASGSISYSANIIVAGNSSVSASGGTLTYSNGYALHSFTSTGMSTFTPTSSANYEILLVAGGGGGGFDFGGGGGGGGTGYKDALALSAGTTYSIEVGSGGIGATSYAAGGTGGDTAIKAGGSLIAKVIGGKGGGTCGWNGSICTSNRGGSGGEVSTSGWTNINGASGGNGWSYQRAPASGRGSDGTATYSISGTSLIYGGGGGGGADAPGGAGGGAKGSDGNSDPASAIANRGGGGGGAASPSATYSRAGNGGSGVAYIRYKIDDAAPVITWTTPSSASTVTSASYTPVWNVTDSGIAGISSAGTVTRQYKSYTSGSCSGSWTNDGTYSSNTAQTLTANRCYQWAFTSAPDDNASNATTSNLISSTVIYDPIATVSSVTSSNTNGVYTYGQTLSFTVTFSEAVTVTGTPKLTLETGTTDEIANCSQASSPSTTMVCTFTVDYSSSSNDLDYASTSALSLNGGTISDYSNNAVLTLPTLGGLNSIAGSKAIVIKGSSLIGANGGTVSVSGNYVIHTFTSSGTFSVDSLPAGAKNVDVLVVGGGGGGGFDGAGGGGGGQVNSTTLSVANTNSFSITVGSGGNKSTTVNGKASNGGISKIANGATDLVLARGGGGGGSKGSTGTDASGSSTIATGGGGGHGSTYAGGTGNSTFGFAGGSGVSNSGGGGGGASTAGANASSSNGGTGGSGVTSSLSGNSIVYGSGGGGGSFSGTGGNGATNAGNGGGSSIAATLPVANTGSGGGGGGVASTQGTDGAVGIVIVRYLIDSIANAPTITSNQNGTTTSGSTDITFTGEAGATFQCKIDSGTYSSCTSPYSATGLSSGSHTFYVKLIDAFSNESSASSITWTVDSTSPTVSDFSAITSSPTNDLSIEYELTFSESVTGLTSADFTYSGWDLAVTSGSGAGPYVITLSKGSAVSGNISLVLNSSSVSDAVGNAISSSLSNRTAEVVLWDIAAPTAPTISLNSLSCGVQRNSSATATFSSTDATSGVAGYRYTLDESTPSISSSQGNGLTVSNQGITTLKVRAIDNAENLSDITSCVIDIDSVAPLGNWDSQPISPTSKTSVSYRLLFDQIVTGLDASDFSISGTATGCVVSVSGSGFSYTVTVDSCSEGTFQITLLANSVTDDRGNVGPVVDASALSVIRSVVVATINSSSLQLTYGTSSTSTSPIAGSGGLASLTYSISPSLPSGLAFSTSTGAITGTPTVISNSAIYTVSITDGNITTNATFALEVETKSLVITTNSQTTNYLDAYASAITASGLVSGDVIDTVSYSYSGADSDGVSYSSTSVPTDSGSYTATPTAITLSSGSLSNYDISFVGNSLTINKISQSTLNFSALSSTVYYQETTTLASSGGSGSGSVSYSVTAENPCSISGLTLTSTGVGSCVVTATKASSKNYNSKSTSITITAAAFPVTLTADDITSVYGGTFTQTFTSSSLKNSDQIGSVTYTYEGTGSTTYSPSATKPSSGGTYSITPLVSTLSTGDLTNYSFSYVVGDLQITSNVNLTIVAESKNINYGDSLTETFSSTGLVNSDDISGITYTYTGSGSTSYGPSVNKPTNVGTYLITPSNPVFSSGSAGAYLISYTAGALTISTKSITITADAVSVNYLETFNPTITGSVLVGSDSIGSVTYSYSGRSSTSYSTSTTKPVNAGTYTITPSAAVFSSGSSSNYAITYATGNLSISQINQSTLTAVLASSSIEHRQTTTISTTGGSGSGSVSYSASGDCTISGTTISTTSSGSCAITATKASSANYLAINSSPVALTINADATPPTAIITTNSGSYSNSDTLTYAITFSENVTGLATSDFTASGWVKTLSGTGNSYILILSSPDVSVVDGTIALVLASGSVTDGLNVNAGAVSNTDIIRDTVVPTSVPIFSVTPTTGTTDRNPTFRFSGAGAGENYQCNIDSNAYSTCSQSITFSNLTAGTRTIYLRITDLAGNYTSAIEYSWTIIGTSSDSGVSKISTSTPPSPTSSVKTKVTPKINDDKSSTFNPLTRIPEVLKPFIDKLPFIPGESLVTKELKPNSKIPSETKPLEIINGKTKPSELRIIEEKTEVFTNKVDSTQSISSTQAVGLVVENSDGNYVKVSPVADEGPKVDTQNQRIIVTAGAQIKVEAVGYAPNSEFALWLRSDPVFIGRGVANRFGEIKATFNVPKNVPLGDHKIELNGLTKKKEVRSVAVPATFIKYTNPGNIQLVTENPVEKYLNGLSVLMSLLFTVLMVGLWAVGATIRDQRLLRARIRN